jgi:endonuclease/exonuclease/phosphatase family metal-dependent hydrolase
LPVLIRSWNVFHGNSSPPTRRSYLKEMVRLASADGPDALCLQEVPVWALPRLAGWSGMRVLGDAARGPRLPPPLDRLLTGVNTGLFRSLFTGQANAILLRLELGVRERSVFALNERSVLGIGAGERRICQIVRLGRPAAGTLVLAHLHATHTPGYAQAQVERAVDHVLELAQPDEPIVLAGDFNLIPDLRHLGFKEERSGIDHVLVRGDDPSPLHVWPDERRRLDGMLLSDHAPVERSLA